MINLSFVLLVISKKNNHGLATIVSEAVKHIPVRMISYGGSENNISLLVPTSYKN